MIYTITLNPALDYFMEFDAVTTGEVNRAKRVLMRPGGKGLIESRMMTLLGVPNIALGFLGGFSGKFIQDFLDKEGVKTAFTPISEATRMNMTAKTAASETSFNAAGPNLTADDVAKFLKFLDELTAGDIVVLAGKSLESLGADFYQTLIGDVKAHGATFAIDVEGKDVLEALPHHPLIIKPNKTELEEIFDTKFDSVKAIIPYGRKMLEMGAQHVMVSMAGEGALLFTADKVYFAPPVKGIIKNSVGAGDSTVAGFIAEFDQSQDAVKAFHQGIACGTAKVFSEDMPGPAFLQKCYQEVKIEEIG